MTFDLTRPFKDHSVEDLEALLRNLKASLAEKKAFAREPGSPGYGEMRRALGSLGNTINRVEEELARRCR
jgi:hypothetical protein